MSDTKPEAQPHVYAAISAITQAFVDIGGISKDRTNSEQKYKFRGIDDVYNHLAPLLPKNNLVILPKFKKREVSERLTKSGSKMFNVILEVDYIFRSLKDGSEYVLPYYGEGTDTGDKATNKAASAAYKVAVIQTFCIPVEGEQDPDQNTPAETKGDAHKHQDTQKPQRAVHTFWNSADEQKAWATATDAQIAEWGKLASDRRKSWLEKALKHLPVLTTPEDIVRWKTANARFIDQLGPKQKEHLLSQIAEKMKAVASAPLPSSGEEPVYDTQTGEVQTEEYSDEIPF